MNQNSYQAITAMLNAFPQSGAASKALLLTYDEDLKEISDQAICETAQRYRRGEIPDQHKTFAPSIAEFVAAARNQVKIIVSRSQARLPAPIGYIHVTDIPGAKDRMRLKMPMWLYAFNHRLMDELAAASADGFGAMVVLASKWGIEVPPELLEIPDYQAEQQWRTARNRAVAEIERNPPPYMRSRKSA